MSRELSNQLAQICPLFNQITHRTLYELTWKRATSESKYINAKAGQILAENKFVGI